MSYGPVLPFRDAIGFLTDVNGARWNDPAKPFCMILLADTYVPSAAHSTYLDVKAHEITDVDYARQLLANRAIVITDTATQFHADDVGFGAAVSITAKYALIVQSAADAIADGAGLLTHQDLSVEGGSAVSNGTGFSVLKPLNGWIDIARVVA